MRGDVEEISFGESSADEKEPLLPPPVPADTPNMDDTKEETVPRKQGITKERLFVVLSILATELCERLTYYSVVANMVLFCTSILKMSSDDASVVTLVFAGTVYIIPVFGGYVADSFAGKFNTILGAGLIYVLGLVLLPASAVDYTHWFNDGQDLSQEARKAYFFLGLVFVAIGTGGIKANVGPFGAQQVDDLGADAVQSFFNWFYWFINAGAVVAYSGVAYIQQEIGFDYGFLVPLISMIVAIIIFILAKKRYRHIPPGGYQDIHKVWMSLNSGQIPSLTMELAALEHLKTTLSPDSILTQSFKVCYQAVHGCKKSSFNRARNEHGGSYSNEMVDGVIAVMRVIPVFILVIIYWAVYSQMSTSLFLQSERMDISVGKAKMPAAMLNIFNTLIILILIPIMDRIVYPFLAKIGRSPSHLQRIGIGMILAALAMVYAGVLEIYRKKDIEANGPIVQSLGKDDFNASKLSMFVQVPEFAFIGSSEVFASISGLEFAYTQAPSFMQGLIMGLFLMTSGLGSYVASAIVAIVKAGSDGDWFPKEPNNGHIEYLLFLLASLTFVNLGVFIIVARFYKYRVPDFETREEDRKINIPDSKYAFDNSVAEKGLVDEKPPLESDQTRL